MEPTARRLSSAARLALVAQGLYILVISTIPFVRLLRLGAAEHQPLVLQFVLWSVIPAVALLVAGSEIGRGLEPIAQRVLRGSGLAATAYLALGCVLVLIDPSTTMAEATVRFVMLVACAIGGEGLVRSAPGSTSQFALAPASAPQGASSRSATTIR